MAVLDILLPVLKVLPVVSASIWYSIAGLQIFRDRFHTWTEAFFLGACFFTGLYALSDLFYFWASSADIAGNFARLSVSSLTFAPVFFFLFTQAYVRKMRRSYFALFVAPPLLLPVVWLRMLERVDVGAGTGLYYPYFDPLSFSIWLAFITIFASAGIVNLFRIYLAVREHSANLGRRAIGLTTTFMVVFFLGVLTNGLQGVFRLPFPPPFSTLLAIPGALAFVALNPGTRERISEAVRRFRARHYVMQSAFLVFNDGTLIGSIGREGDTGVDRDLLMATLDVIQNFMRTSFPILKGKSLKTIEHGDVRILIERGRFCYLAIVLTGEENDLLRRQMRDELLDFEQRNLEVLAKWRGVQEDAVGTEGMLGRLLEPPRMFELVVAQ